jgi:antitoxin CcdA
MRMNFVEADMGAKRAVNLSLDSDLLDEAKSYGFNLSRTVEASLVEALRKERARRWQQENAEAIRASNEELERNGLWSDGLRTF